MPLKEAAAEVADTVIRGREAGRCGQHAGAPRRRGVGRHQHRRRRPGPGAVTAPRGRHGTRPRAGRRGHGTLGRAGPGRARRHDVTVRARDTSRAADLLAWALDLGAGIRNGSVAALGPWITTGDDVVVSTLPGVGGRGRGRHRAVRAPGRAARRRVRRVADAARPRRCRGRHDRGLGTRHARAPGGRAVPAVHRGHAAPSTRWSPPAAPRWGRRDPGLGRARRGPGHGRWSGT